MKIAHIYPLSNIDMYRTNEYNMLLAQYAEKGFYDQMHIEHCFNIMDNGLYEGKQVSKNLYDLYRIVKAHKLKIDEMVVPDVANNCEENLKLFIKNIGNMKAIRRQSPKMRFMVVAQGKTIEEIIRAIRFIERKVDEEDMHYVTIAISKLTPCDRTDKYLRQVYRECTCPIHFLGLKHVFEELSKVKTIIRSCDTCQLSWLIGEDFKYRLNQLNCENVMKKQRKLELNALEDVHFDTTQVVKALALSSYVDVKLGGD